MLLNGIYLVGFGAWRGGATQELKLVDNRRVGFVGPLKLELS